MAITVLPRNYNPWTASLPGFFQNLVFQKMSQKFEAGQAEKSREFEAEEGKKTRSAQMERKLLTQKPGTITQLKVDDSQGKPIYLNVRPMPDGSLQYLGTGTRFKPGVTANINLPDMTKRTKGELEGRIVQGQDTLAKLDRVEKLFKDEYLEYAGKGKAWLQDVGSKLGMPTGKFLEGYKQWASEVDAHTLLWRKFITGVAGGPKEMEAIERTTINTKYDSPASYRAKAKQIRIMTDAQIKRDKELLAKGFNLRQMSPEDRAKIAEQYPIEDYGYEEIEIPKGKETGTYTPGKLYEDAGGNQMRFGGYDRNGKPVWEQP
jgi:hypothetical protein